MGLIGAAGTLKLALGRFRAQTPRMGITQWFDFEASRPGGAIDAVDAPCFAPRSGANALHHTSSPKDPMHLADFSARLSARPAPVQQRKAFA